MSRSATDLGDEAAACIETCGLRGDQLRLYLAVFIAECVCAATLEDMAAMRENLPLAKKRYEKELIK